MDIRYIVARNVKAIREEKQLTLEAAAEATGVSRSMLAQIEKGDVNPTISVLWKIANGFKLSFSTLIEQKTERVDLVRLKAIQPFIEDEGRYINYPIFPFDAHSKSESYRIIIRPGGSLTAQPHLKGTQEYITVFSGRLELTVDGVGYELEAGDSIRFFADLPHGYNNPGDTDTQLSMQIHYSKD